MTNSDKKIFLFVSYSYENRPIQVTQDLKDVLKIEDNKIEETNSIGEFDFDSYFKS